MKRIVLLLFLASFSWGYAQESEVLTPMDIAKLQQVTSAMITEDGKTVYYTVSVPADPKVENAPASSHLYKYDTDTKAHTALITDHSVGNLAFRPGSNTLTFTAKPEGADHTGIYEMTAEGGAPALILSYGNSISGYDWNPDGNTLAFIAKEVEEETKPDLPYTPEIYEEGMKMSRAFVTDLRSDKLTEIPMSGHVTAVAWNGNGGQIAVRVSPSTLVDDFYTSQKIYILNTIDRSIAGEVMHKGKMGPMKWSPDSKFLAFIAGADEHDPTAGRLFKVRPVGGSPMMQAEGMEGSIDGLQWSADGHLMFLASEGVSSTLGSIDKNGKMTRLYTSQNYAINDFSAANNGVVAVVASTPEHPSELFLLKGMGSAPERITDLNPWLKNKKMGKQEVIVYKAKDGMEIQGLLIHPVEKNGPVPMITVVHGGPEAHYDNGWLTGYSMPGQMAAGQGFAVFYPNYRGSTGRGVKFAMSSQGDPGGKEFDDIIDGIDHLIANYGIDKDRVGVTGGSYGGYATAWMSTRHTKRFAAGVMFVGISNNLSKWGTSDIPEEMFLVHSRKRIWDDYEFFLKRSPIYYADQAETPLLIMHGKNDTRVDPGQSYELYRHIKTRTDTPVRMVLYPGEGHGNRKSTARYDYSLRMMRWFDHYLKQKKEDLPQMENKEAELLFKN
ncbi:S9 family peptidase [Robertkochia sediminum]|uniref:S9 family peptidase n=1 Tax=Robertkochia sediminum TaxID=2785326 RepID=UPI0019326DA4|nr:S9 family peptidase [Robertkochia sediminum]MBL7472017.1 S9 family peptidase [Robertkochia sediminum]